jgi:hypothetical protein
LIRFRWRQEEASMEMFLGALAFAALIALQLAAVIAVHHARLDRQERPTPGRDRSQEDPLGIRTMSGD